MSLTAPAIVRWDRALRLGTLALVVILALLSMAGFREAVLVATPPLLVLVSLSRLVLAAVAFRAGQAIWGPSLAEGIALGLLGLLTHRRDVESPLLLVVVALLLASTFIRRRLAERPDDTPEAADEGADRK